MQSFIELRRNGIVIMAALNESAEGDDVMIAFEDKVVRFNTETSGWDSEGNFLEITITQS